MPFNEREAVCVNSGCRRFSRRLGETIRSFKLLKLINLFPGNTTGITKHSRLDYEENWIPPWVLVVLSMTTHYPWHGARCEIEATFRQVELILTVSASGPAPRGLSSTGETNFNRLWTLLGVPCVNVLIDPEAEQLPVGVQLIASYRADRRAIEAAVALESALNAQRCLGA